MTMHGLTRTALFSLALLLAGPGVAVSMSDPDKPVSSDDSVAGQAKSRVGATGVVRSAGGAPVSGAVVLARSLDKPGRPIPEIAIMSAADGTYFWPLRPGRYELTALADGERGAPGVVTVSASGAARLDLTLP